LSGSLLFLGLEVFGVIFLFEIFDRTNFSVIGLASRHAPRDVWLGAAGAFAVSSAISVAVGAVLVSTLPAYVTYIRIAAGVLLLAFGVRTLLSDSEKEGEALAEKEERRLSPWKVWSIAFALILLMEMGDNTQILTFEFVAAAGAGASELVLVTIFLAATFALWSVAAVGSRSGAFLRSRVPAERLERVMGSALVIVGIVTILWALGVLPLPSI
jgi:putative Ca2+/H+ antiporter (TMEM165/GDT1 family)